jgi:type II secretory pathway pseudopilin PulG
MMVVAIVVILGAVSTPLYMKYLYRARASEAPGVLMEIWNQQKAYRTLTNGQGFDSVSDDGNDWYPSSPPTDAPAKWTNDPDWTILLGRTYPPQHAEVYFRYLTVAGNAGSDPSAVLNGVAGFPAGAFANDWFIARALGDLDNDGTTVTFEVSSEVPGARTLGSADDWE